MKETPMANTSDLLTGASQLAALQAQRAGEGFSKDPGDYKLPWVKLSPPELNSADPKYKPELDPKGFSIGDEYIAPGGAPVIILGMLSGHEEKDRVRVDGREEKRRFKIWKYQPEITVVRGKGGGLRTERGGWITSKFDEIFLLTAYGLAVATLYDMHDVVAKLNQLAQSLGAAAMYEIRWQLTKESFVDDGGYTHVKPHFELLGVAGEPNGPSDRELAQAKKLSALVAQISYPVPGAPLKLVVNGEPMDEPPAPHPDDPGAEPPSDGPDYGPGPDDDIDVGF
jgi:hypothetical protein